MPARVPSSEGLGGMAGSRRTRLMGRLSASRRRAEVCTSRSPTLQVGRGRHTRASLRGTLPSCRAQETAMRPSIDSQAVRTTDADLAEQAKPGHGVPSQDPDPAAQSPMDDAQAEAEGKSVFVGAGVLAGAATGAAVGTAVAGPVGVIVGGTIGAVAGAIGGAAAGSLRETGEDQSKEV